MSRWAITRTQLSLPGIVLTVDLKPGVAECAGKQSTRLYLLITPTGNPHRITLGLLLYPSTEEECSDGGSKQEKKEEKRNPTEDWVAVLFAAGIVLKALKIGDEEAHAGGGEDGGHSKPNLVLL